MTLHQYLDTLKNKTVAVVGIGVSNTPWLRRLLQEGIRVTACDKRSRDALGAGIGTGYPDRGGVPGGLLNVPGVVFADRLRHRVLEGQEVRA